MERKLYKHIRDAIQALYAIEGDFTLEHPDEMAHGDYSTSAALALSKKLKMKPRDVAEGIATKLREKDISGVEKIEIAGAGFINFTLAKEFFGETIRTINAEGESYGKNGALRNKKIIIEYTNTNLFKELHIGHMMSNNIGESLSRILEWSGAEVKRDTYQGDVGLHVAKAIFGMIALKEEMPRGDTLKENIAFLGKAYAHGSTLFEEDEKAAEEIKHLNKTIFDKSDPKINDLYAWGREVSLKHFEELYKKLDTKFDYYFFESNVAMRALEIVKEGLQKGIFEESDGAVVFKGEQFGLHTRVFVNSLGLPTYEAKDLGLAEMKYKTYPFDLAIIITANEQNDYFKVVFKALSLLNPEVASKIQHVSHGMLRLPSGKMGSRKGNVITGEGLLSQVEALVEERVKEREMSAKERESVKEKVGVAAIKYSILKQTVGSDIVYDFDKSISFEGDSGPYLQYSCVRAKSILKKAEESGVISAVSSMPKNWNPTVLERMLYRFPEAVERSGREYSPSFLATYLTELASVFNSFYAEGQIVSKEDPDSPYKVSLTEAFSIVIENGLRLLGIKVPEKM